MLGKDGTEKRKKFRVFVRIPVVCEYPDAQTPGAVKTKTAVSGDISQEGLYFEIEELLPLKTELKVKFQLPHSKNIINAIARVVRVESLKTNFGIGTFFTQIAEQDRQEIEQLVERLNINRLLKITIEKGASDLHLLAEQPPVLRINGELTFLTDAQVLHVNEIPQLVFSLMTKEQIRAFERDKELDFGIQFDIASRFRVNVHQQRGFVEAAFRLIESKTFDFGELRIPPIVQELARQKDGLVLVTGPTGSGKSTTIAAMVGLINVERKAVIITLERPIEFTHKNVKSIIKQREIGVDTSSFSVALKSSLRQDPNVIVIGEMDDAETVRTAVMAAEAGYLVIGTFHAPDTIQAIDRLVSLFPAENRRQMLSQLANCLKGIVAQVLLPKKDRTGRVLASEVLVANDAVKRIIRKDEIFQLANVIQTGTNYKMQAMADVIRDYLQEGVIDAETAGFYSQEFNKYAL
ncbi:MAG: PilT/PilU family type 4a pilus ATPase [Deltaproteobacteria bacterium]